MRGKFALLAAGLVAGGLALAQPGPALSVDAQAARHSISPDIYGINWWWDGEADFNNRPPTNPNVTAAAADLRVGVRRWGGNNMSRYNWRLDVWNIDADWFFEVLPDNNPRPDLLPDGSRFNGFLEYTRVTGSKLMGTIPLLEWLPKARQRMCSFSVLKYGTQCSTDQYFADCGNGVISTPTCANSPQYIQNDPRDAAAQFDESYQRDWVAYVVSKYGRADQGGVAFWSLDNEPVWWSSTHRDVHPLAQTYDETLNLGIAYAAAIKDADPTALVAGPVQAGWGSYFYSLTDMNAGWARGGFWMNPTDRIAHGGVDFSSWYLQQFKQYEDQNSRRLLDYFDLHAYNIIPDTMSDSQRLQSTRVLWDPAYTAVLDTFWVRDANGQPVAPRLIPRMRDWVNQNYPGTKTAITEYIWGALNTMNGGLAQADILGIFGREGLDLGTLWGTLKTTDPGAFAFKIYRNYDGIGGAFGETSVQATTGNPDQLSIFAAQRSDSALTILVLNKTSGGLSSTINISNFTPDQNAQVWQYSQANLTAILGPANVAVTGSTISATFPASSMTLFVVPASPSVLPVPKPVITAVTNAASYQSRIAPGQMVIVW
ncbi:MAG: glycoside hydrolase family 44 protein [Bryobacteraceae bacterium]